jgi:integrase
MCQLDPFFRNVPLPVQQQSLLAFAARIRTGSLGKGRQVGYQSVEKAMRHVAQTQVLAGFPDPRRRYGTKELDLPFQHLLKSLKDEDPPPRPQLALPVDTIALAAAAALQPLASPLATATGDLITAAFYFLLRVGEYTMPSKNRRTRTVQFRCQDVRLWRNRQLIPHDAPLAQLLLADSVTLYLDNQKNGNRGATIHHTAVDGWFCPAKCLARRVASIRQSGMPDSTPLSYVSPGTHVVADHILKAVRAAAMQSGLVLHAGYSLDRIGAHSLRASGAMALKLNGYSAEDIMKIGRWTSTTFLTYIHSQIAALNHGIAANMSRRIAFHNVGG